MTRLFPKLYTVLPVLLQVACTPPAEPGGNQRVCTVDGHGAKATPFGPDVLEEPGQCFYNEAPGADAFVADVPRPVAGQCPALPALRCDESDQPSPIAVEVWPSEDVSPTEEEPWAAIVEGAQGYAHTWVRLRAALPLPEEPTRIVQVRAVLCIDRRVIAVAERKVRLNRQADGRYASGKDLVPMVIPALPGIAFQFCGYWATVRLEVLDVDAHAWGSAESEVRLYAKPVGQTPP